MYYSYNNIIKIIGFESFGIYVSISLLLVLTNKIIFFKKRKKKVKVHLINSF